MRQKKRKLPTTTDEDLKQSEKRSKYENSKTKNTSSNTENRYMTCSKTSLINSNVESTEINLSQSKK